MIFHDWIKQFEKSQSAVGDLARDMKEDGDFPKSASLKEMLDYLDNKGACDGAIDALKDAYNKWTINR